MRPAAFAAVLLASTAAFAQAPRYVGDWTATVICADTPNGPRGYNFQFPTTVRGNQVQGERGTKGQAGYTNVSGPIQADGSATLVVTGVTGDVKYSTGRANTGTSYAYRVNFHFADANHGDGQRIGERACTLRLVR